MHWRVYTRIRCVSCIVPSRCIAIKMKCIRLNITAEIHRFSRMMQSWLKHIWDDHNTKICTQHLAFHQPSACGLIEIYRSIVSKMFVHQRRINNQTFWHFSLEPKSKHISSFLTLIASIRFAIAGFECTALKGAHRFLAQRQWSLIFGLLNSKQIDCSYEHSKVFNYFDWICGGKLAKASYQHFLS